MWTAERSGWWEALPTKHRVTFVAWVSFNEVAIAASFLFPSLLMVNAVANGWEPIWQFLVVVAGGVAQGFLVGLVQWALLARAGVTPPLLAWVAYISLGVGLAWAIGQIPILLPRDAQPTMLTSLTNATLVVGLAFPMIAEWLVLRRVSRRATVFAAISWAGWLVGAAIMGGTQLVLSSVTDLKTTIGLLVLGAFAGVFVVAVATWFAGVQLTKKSPAKKSPVKKKG